MPEFVAQLSVWVLPVLLAVILHEIAHGAVADRLGDPTARLAGRLTLNPLPHIDPVGTVAFPLLVVYLGLPVFGWARPVPVNVANLRHPRRDGVLVALAGPLTNVGLACAAAAVIHLLAPWRVPDEGFGEGAAAAVLTPLWLMAGNAVVFNVLLAVFNLLPILPLDGGRVLVGLLPRAPALALARLEPYGMLIVMALLMTDTLDRVMSPLINLLVYTLL
jgi:Zn-dependent protease